MEDGTGLIGRTKHTLTHFQMPGIRIIKKKKKKTIIQSMMPKITTVILNNILMNQIRQLNSPKKRLVCTKQVRKPDINPYRYVIQQENIVIDNQ
jgi:hypothetical protein